MSGAFHQGPQFTDIAAPFAARQPVQRVRREAGRRHAAQEQGGQRRHILWPAFIGVLAIFYLMIAKPEL